MMSGDSSPAITAMLSKWRNGDQEAFEVVINYVYGELRRRAAAYVRGERPGHTLQTTGLVHETFIKLVNKKDIEYSDRNHFYAVASQAMRRILVDHARTKNRLKRGFGQVDVSLDEARTAIQDRPAIDHVALDAALDRLAAFDPRQAQVVELKYFGGMSLEETAEVLNVSVATVKRDWQIARAWLRQQLH